MMATKQAQPTTSLTVIVIAVGLSVLTQYLLSEHTAPLRKQSLEIEDAAIWQAPFVFSWEVEEALKHNRAVVALESTIISHGMPYPANLKTAREVEEIIRKQGATPATIAIVNGTVHIGLDSDVLEWLACHGKLAVKCSRRDVAAIVAEKQTGASTVAATALLARRAHPNIRVFVTGGIGGVHRGGEDTMDISADLTELGRTDITVVCAGTKSILDIGRTLEYLETQGVTVIGYGTDDFPAFFSPTSGFRAPLRLDTPNQVARLIAANSVLKLGSGIVVGVPIPPQDAARNAYVEVAIKSALQEADRLKVIGREITPFLLQRVAELTGGDSLDANIALVKNNAFVGANIAVELANHMATTTNSKSHVTAKENKIQRKSSSVAVLGGAVVDLTGQPHGKLHLFTSNPGALSLSIGGVGRNIAEGLARLELAPQLLSVIGKDLYGDMIIAHTASVGMDTSTICRVDHATGIYTATLDERGGLVVAIAATSIFDIITPEYLSKYENQLSTTRFIVMDANAPIPTLKYVCDIAHKNNIDIWFEPTSVAKGVKIVEADALPLLTYISPNRGELVALVHLLEGNETNLPADDDTNPNVYKPLVARLLTAGVKGVVAKLGPAGVLVGTVADKIVHYPAPPVKVVSVTGAGDSLAAGTIWALHRGLTLYEAVQYGIAAAHLTLESEQALSPKITPDRLRQMVQFTLDNTVKV